MTDGTDRADDTLLVVEDAFPARAGGTFVLPKITADRATRAPFPVSLLMPDGATRLVTASLEVAHVRGPLPPFGMLRLHALSPEEVPIGTQIRAAPSGR